ncbi:MAG: flavin reductase family protein [Actinomycetota bacterium]|nr:flavin reductase family protein [Actinomycetota bacterium]
MTDELGDLVAAADGAMVVVTAHDPVGDERDGCLVGFHAQCSIDPPRYAVWLSVTNRTHRVARSSSHLTVHFLAATDHALAARFGGVTGDDLPNAGDSKLEQVDWVEGPGGVPVLQAVAHRFVGRIVAFDDEPEGDHSCVVLEPVEVVAPDRAEPPLRLSQASDIEAGHEA